MLCAKCNSDILPDALFCMRGGPQYPKRRKQKHHAHHGVNDRIGGFENRQKCLRTCRAPVGGC